MAPPQDSPVPAEPPAPADVPAAAAPLEPPIEEAPAVKSSTPPEANDITGLRAVSVHGTFENGAAEIMLGEFAKDVHDVWLVDGKGEQVAVDSFEAESVNQGATKLTVKAKGQSGEQTVQVYITA